MEQSAQLPTVRWISSALHPERRVAQPTLVALEHMLQHDEPGTAPGGPSRLDDVPALASVGGIALLNTPDGRPVGVARVGRTSFVGYRLTAEGLAEVEVVLDEANGALTIGPGT